MSTATFSNTVNTSSDNKIARLLSSQGGFGSLLLRVPVGVILAATLALVFHGGGKWAVDNLLVEKFSEAID